MNKDNELALYAKMVLDDERFDLVAEDLRSRLTTSILTSSQEQSSAREGFVQTWWGFEAFRAVLQSYVNDANSKEMDEEAERAKIQKAKRLEESKQNALREL